MLVDRANPPAQRTWIADFGGETHAAHPNMRVAAHSLAFHFISLVPDAKGKHVRRARHGVDFDLAAVEPAMTSDPLPDPDRAGILAVDGDFISHGVSGSRPRSRYRIPSPHPSRRAALFQFETGFVLSLHR